MQANATKRSSVSPRANVRQRMPAEKQPLIAKLTGWSVRALAYKTPQALQRLAHVLDRLGLL